MKKLIAVLLAVCFLFSLSGCFAEKVSLFYKEFGEQDGFTVAVNQLASCCFVGEYECEEYTENMQITIPDEYNGIPVKRLGGSFGRGIPIPFCIIYADPEVDYSDPHNPWHDKASYSISEDDHTQDVVFQLHIGKNIEVVEFVNMDTYYPHINAVGLATYYHPVVYVTCSEENSHFYAEDGKLYYRETDELVTEFAYAEPVNFLTRTEDGTYLNKAGTEYVFLSNEWETPVYCFGDWVMEGRVYGEEASFTFLDITVQTGFFSLRGDQDKNILVRQPPNSEWYQIYRKASLPPLDLSADNCNRLELVKTGGFEFGVKHTTCGEGITDQAVIAEFLSDIRSQPSPRDAGLFNLVQKPNGMLENCYQYAVIYGFFEEEPNIAISMAITSYNDLAYSVSIGNEEYVLPEAWLQRLQDPQ